jgi:hypothetical protein
MKITKEYQEKYRNNQFYNEKICQRNGISKNVKLHDEINNPLSSAAACLNVMGYLNQNQDKIIPFFNYFGLDIENILSFPSGVNLHGENYDDKGPIVFEWIEIKTSLNQSDKQLRSQVSQTKSCTGCGAAVKEGSAFCEQCDVKL